MTQAQLELGAYTVPELKQLMGLTAPEQEQAFQDWLAAEQGAGRLVTYLSGKKGPAHPIRTGVVSAHPKGFGFVTEQLTGQRPVETFIPPATMNLLLAGDVVSFHSMPGKEGRGRLAEVLSVERPTTAWLGKVVTRRGSRVLVPDSPANLTLRLPEDAPVVAPGEVVLVHVEAGTPLSNSVLVKFIRNLGEPSRQGFDSDYAIGAYMLPSEFSLEAIEEAESLPEPVLEDGRADLRALPFVTIDGESTRDFDDAIQVEQKGDHFILRVAVADVSHYVPVGSALDKEAHARGTSVYLPDRVIPMLPGVLSNGLCSLNQDQARYALVCEMEISAKGLIESFCFYTALIESKARLTYNQVTAFTEGLTFTVPEEQASHMACLMRLCAALEEGRAVSATLQLDTKEARLYLGNDGLTHIRWTSATVAHRYIELCMLAANHCAARLLKDSGLAGLFRHHKGPSLEDWDEARTFLREKGIELGESPSLKEMARVLEETRNGLKGPQVENALLKMLPAATYDKVRPSHFSLDTPHYAHFTSPIRRYPDLLVHRALKTFLVNPEGVQSALPEGMAEHCSRCATRAQKASNQVWTKLKRRYVAQHQIGAFSTAKVVKASSRGIKVFLQEWQTMGWLSASELETPFEEGQLIYVEVTQASDAEILVQIASAPSSTGQRPHRRAPAVGPNP